MSLLSFLGLGPDAAGRSAAFDAQHGMALLHQSKFDEVAKYFERHLEKNAFAHYGLALSRFRRDPANLSVADLKPILQLLEAAIALSPEFSDAYFMCAMAYNQAAGLQLGSYNKNRNLVTRDSFGEPDAYLAKADQYFRKAMSVNPGFTEIAEREITLNQQLQAFSRKTQERVIEAHAP